MWECLLSERCILMVASFDVVQVRRVVPHTSLSIAKIPPFDLQTETGMASCVVAYLLVRGLVPRSLLVPRDASCSCGIQEKEHAYAFDSPSEAFFFFFCLDTHFGRVELPRWKLVASDRSQGMADSLSSQRVGRPSMYGTTVV
jgi:hypothetical protein